MLCLVCFSFTHNETLNIVVNFIGCTEANAIIFSHVMLMVFSHELLQ